MRSALAGPGRPTRPHRARRSRRPLGSSARRRRCSGGSLPGLRSSPPGHGPRRSCATLSRRYATFSSSSSTSASWSPSGRTGKLDSQTSTAVLGFQKWANLTRDGALGRRNGRGTRSERRGRRPRLRAPGRRIEVQLRRQVALLIEDNRVVRAVHISSGAGGKTPTRLVSRLSQGTLLLVGAVQGLAPLGELFHGWGRVPRVRLGADLRRVARVHQGEPLRRAHVVRVRRIRYPRRRLRRSGARVTPPAQPSVRWLGASASPSGSWVAPRWRHRSRRSRATGTRAAQTTLAPVRPGQAPTRRSSSSRSISVIRFDRPASCGR